MIEFNADSYLERRGMLLHDAVDINCKRGATIENQGAGAMQEYWQRGVCLMIV